MKLMNIFIFFITIQFMNFYAISKTQVERYAPIVIGPLLIPVAFGIGYYSFL